MGRVRECDGESEMEKEKRMGFDDWVAGNVENTGDGDMIAGVVAEEKDC